ncbi:MAG: hypothetical protein Q7J80_07915 [Anaerolineales bacterium]|nr:hypothetical protein [Anaerolineales bacterium]
MNFTLQDILGATLAFCLFPLVIVFPGYVVGWVFNLFEFRARLLPARLAISMLLSIAIGPIFYYLVASWFSLNIALTVTVLIAAAFVILSIYEKPTLPRDGSWRAFFWISLGWAAIAIFSLVDLQWGHQELYFSVASFDHTTRVSIIDAMTRTGVPPINPSYYPGHYVKLTFLYFFWYILGSMIDIAGGKLVDARAALFASVIWCGIALMALIAFYLRLRDGRDQGIIWRRALIGLASLSITGLDIIPAITLMRFGHGALGDLEHWNEQITAWIGSLLWVPHHVASLIAGFVGVMLVHSARGRSRTKQFTALVFSGMAFASALGLSVWVTLVFVLFWGIWMLFLYIQKEQRALLLPMFIAGVAALLLAGPFLLGLLSGGGGGEAGAFPISLTVRSFRFADAFLENSSLLWKSLIRLIFLPLNYFFELGFFALVAFIWLRSHKDDLRENPYYFAEVLLLGISFFIGTFTRSTLIENNDLGWRAWLPGQFVLLIWGVDVLEGFVKSPRPRFVLSQRTKYNLVLLAALGVSTTILDVTLLRFGYYFSFGSESGRKNYSARQAYTIINETLPQDVIVQYNPSGAINRPSGLYGMRQSAISGRTAYGVPLDQYSAKVAAVSEIFNLKNIQTWDPLDALCKEHFIDALVIVESDPLWESLDLLQQQRASLYADDYYAVFACGNYSVSPHTP